MRVGYGRRGVFLRLVWGFGIGIGMEAELEVGVGVEFVVAIDVGANGSEIVNGIENESEIWSGSGSGILVGALAVAGIVTWS